VEGAVDSLIETLRWAGLDYDEGPAKGGAAGPYVQSERISLYRDYVEKLLVSGNAYYAFDTPEELDEMRKAQEKLKLTPKYDRRALKLPQDEVRRKLASGVPAVVRLKVPDGTTIAFKDLVRGPVEFSSEQVDDQVLLKSDGYPTYHLANVVDDHLMGVSHVIRGEEWLSSTPKHVLLYRYLGWEVPAFAHLPLLLNPDKSKLSKRQGDVAVEDYRTKGYLPEALVNFVAFLGWNPGDEREIFSKEELIREFSLDRVGKSGAVFNIEKLNWLNAQHLRLKSGDEIIGVLRPLLKVMAGGGDAFPDEYLLRVVEAMRERVNFIGEYLEKAPYFFHAPESYDPDTVSKRWKPESPTHLRTLLKEFSALENPRAADFESALVHAAEQSQIKKSDLIHPLRLAVSGMGAGPGLYDILAILGKEETLRRIAAAIERVH
jgi:glutamyl-tRNA synthetase